MVISDGDPALPALVGAAAGRPARHVLDCFHISMRVRHIEQAMQGLKALDLRHQGPLHDSDSDVERLHHLLWSGCHNETHRLLAQYPSDVIGLVVFWRLRYKLNLRDLAEMFLTRGFIFSYQAERDWAAKLTPALAENLRRRRKGRIGPSWYIDEIRVRGRWRYLYRALDRDGALIDVMLSEHRDLAAARASFRSAKAVTGVTPGQVTTDGHDAYPRAIRTELGKHVRHRTSRYLNNRVEQDHRGIKSRCRPMLGLTSTVSPARYCRGYDELRKLLRCRSHMR
jgi:putative transposase